MHLPKTILGLICLVLLIAKPAVAQQLNPSETQFFINPYLANPAMAGMKPQELIINSAYRSQWDKVPGSPKTIAFTADYRSPNNVGLGMNFNSQSAGLLTQTNFLLSYAYHIPLSDEEDEFLHMGFSTGFSKDMLDYNRLIGDATDPVVIGYNGRVVNWTVDAGIAYSLNGLTVQLAAPNLNRTMNKKNDFISDYPIFYAAANYEMQISDALMINPKIAFRGIQNYNNILDLGVQVQFKEPFYISALYHSNQSYSLGVAYAYENQWQLVCMYNTPTQNLKGLANGIFEMGLRFRFSNLAKENR
jgi:type IX secretion system PorP/SprF family membrane protein